MTRVSVLFSNHSRSLGRFQCLTSAYEHAQFSAHIGVGTYNPYAQAASLKVPGLDGYPGFGSPSALQQALLSPTPLEYRVAQQQQQHQHHVTPVLQGLLSPRHSLTGHADPRLTPHDLANLLKRSRPAVPANNNNPPPPPPPEYTDNLLLNQVNARTPVFVDSILFHCCIFKRRELIGCLCHKPVKHSLALKPKCTLINKQVKCV